ncbi:MAG: response regulator [Tannerella sp.]|jgi:signal transduction histidine kinase/ligand-binding sensor domain-containing protein/DNA-binding response OmpR family regulator|nr:response regulator [Tannerella sp.]
MWIATLHGLNRYNGYEYFQYFHDEADTTSLNHDQVTSLFYDSSHRLWVGTIKGVNRYDFMNNRFVRCRSKLSTINMINSFFEDHAHRIWVASGYGAGWIDTEHMEMHLLPECKYTVHSFWEDDFHRLWMGTAVGLAEFGNDSVLNYYSLPGDKQITSQVYKDPRGRWWLGTNAGLCLFDPVSRTFMETPAPCLEFLNLRKIPINFIQEIDRMQLLIGTESQGLFLYDMMSQTLLHNESRQLNRMNAQEFLSCYVDREKNIWIASYEKGFTVWNKSLNYFNVDYKLNELVRDKFVTRIVEDRYGNLWISTRYHGLFLYTASGTVTVYNAGKNPELFNGDESPIESLFVDSRNRIWIGTQRQLIICNISPDGRITHIAGKEIENVRIMKEDGNGNLWAGTWNGLYKIESGRTPFDRIQHIHTTGNIPDVCILDSGDILFSIYGEGIFRLPAGDSIPKRYDEAPEKAVAVMRNCVTIYEDSQHRIWFGSYLNGMLCRSNDGYRIITKDGGLPNNNVLCFREDIQGNLWISTSQGISRMNPADNTFTTYTKSDGAPGNQYHEKGGLEHSDGRIFFTGNHGLTFFNPLTVLPEKQPPAIHLEDLKILNRSIRPAHDNPVLHASIAYTDHITLNHRQSSFSLDYAGIDFLSPEKLNYACKLEGFDKEWNRVGNFRRATYSNLPPGKYTFRVKAFNGEGMESPAPAELRITVLPAPWFSWPAWTSYILIFLFITFFLFRQSFKIKMNGRLLEIEHREREREREITEMKMHFFTNISHELRTPLTLISAPLEQLWALNLPDKPKRLLETISGNVQNMLKLINQLLDFRKMETGVLALQVQQEDVILLMKNILEVFVPSAEKKQIDLSFIPHVHEFMLWVDTDKLEKILHNLLSNALKHTPEKGIVKIITRELTHLEANKKYQDLSETTGYSYIEITVSDSGHGVPEDKMGDLFIRYRQIDGPSGTRPDYGGSGIGLHYTKRLAEIHNGRIKAVNKPEGGMAFSFILPTGDVFSENEKKAYLEVFTSTPAEQIEPEQTGRSIQKKQYTILIVEDNAELMEFIRNLLSPQYELLTASDGDKGWETAEKESPDLIISDVLMPGISGYQLCAQVKNHPALSHIPVILLTAKSTLNDQLEGLEQGADVYINKPFHVDFLLLTIKNLFLARDRLRHYYADPQTKDETPVPIPLNPYDRKFMDRMMQLLEQELSNPQLNVDALGKELGFSRTAFYRKIKGLTDMSPVDFLRSYRLRRAAEMIREDADTLSGISEKTGFGSYSYFSKSFRNHFGLNPKDYKNQI